MNNKRFHTSVINLENLQPYQFVVPTYQRPYVWGDEQINKLLWDFYKSFLHDRESNYFVGTILTKENGSVAELIDGQQRFTTLWLTAFVFSIKKSNSVIEDFLTNEKGFLKLDFEIRTEVHDYFDSLLKEDEGGKRKVIESEIIVKFPYLKNIANALVTINGIIEAIDEQDLLGFGDYIYRRVQFIKNTTPSKIDLNKLFSTINSSGVQLEQTDIIKANLLKRIDKKVMYGKIWEACENMNNFFERNVRSSFPNTNWKSVNLKNYTEFDEEVFLYKGLSHSADGEEIIFCIDDIEKFCDEEYQESKKDTYKEDRVSEEVYCRSIINFGQLLLHTYRLHLRYEGKSDFEGTFHVNRLIEVFKSLENVEDPEEIERFFLLLWVVRLTFDKYIIKWVTDVDTKVEHLELMNINKNSDNYYSRTRYESSEMLMLQSILYFTGDYLRQFWLTSYIGYLIDCEYDLDGNSKHYLGVLEDYDNQLSLCTKITDKEASLELLSNDLNVDIDIVTYLNKPNGTKFKHYWFQKLEYILWKNWKFDETDEFKSYRITSRNSIEHIYPQNPENLIKNPVIENEYLHSFGNLVLLSVAQNSEYSNKSVDEKRSRFKGKNTYDSLKSYYIFNEYGKSWTETEIEEHKNEMVTLIKQHYSIA